MKTKNNTNIFSGVAALSCIFSITACTTLDTPQKTVDAAAQSPISVHETSFAAIDDASKVSNLGVKTEGDSIILAADSDNGGWVENDDHYLHTISGMTCPKGEPLALRFDGSTLTVGVLPLHQIQVFNALGTDTACHYKNNDGIPVLSVYASRWPDTTLDDHFEVAKKHIFTSLNIDSETTVMVPGGGDDEDEGDEQASSEPESPAYVSTIEGETKAAGYLIKTNHKDIYIKTVLWLNKTGDWHVKGRFSFISLNTELDIGGMLTESFAGSTYYDRLEDVDKHINTGPLTQVRH